MPALTAGTAAPDFSAIDLKGNHFSLKEALSRGPVVLAFFKVSCPVCQFALPYLERLYQLVKGKGVSVVGVSQNGKQEAAAFVHEYGITFPVVLDDPRTYPASNAYGLTNVPSIFFISPEGEIELSSVGWSRQDLDTITRNIAEYHPAARVDVFQRGEQVPDFKAG